MTIEEEIAQIQSAQDSRAQVFGYNLIRHKEDIIKAFAWVVCYPGDPPTDPEMIKALREMCSHIRHEVSRHANANAYHQKKIEALRKQAKLRCASCDGKGLLLDDDVCNACDGTGCSLHVGKVEPSCRSCWPAR